MTYMAKDSVFSVQTQTVKPIPIPSFSHVNVFIPYTGFPSISTANPFNSYMRFAGKPYPDDVCGMFQYPSIDIPCISRVWKTNKGKKTRAGLPNGQADAVAPRLPIADSKDDPPHPFSPNPFISYTFAPYPLDGCSDGRVWAGW
jgi:hypothetical protein